MLLSPRHHDSSILVLPESSAMTRRIPSLVPLAVLGLMFSARAGLAQAPPLPPVPVPAENPITEAKRVLGKILFWDEQLSSDDTIACGTCHLPEFAGSDPRLAVNPGSDETFGTPDDVLASPGVALADAGNRAIESELFGFAAQVTPRATQAIIGTQFAGRQFWDGRATGVFEDPESESVLIPFGGALETQALGPLLSPVEMAHEDRDWDQVRLKVHAVTPLAYASELPPDLRDALASSPTYPELFEQAFGDGEVTPARIAMAIATYERTLIPDQTPWDLFNAGDGTALTPAQVNGLNTFRNAPCSGCHRPPMFTDNAFHNLGLRPWEEDPGQMEVSGDFNERGRFKTPTLRGVGLKASFMHTGGLRTLRQVVDFYLAVNGQTQFPDGRAPGFPLPPFPPGSVPNLIDFLTNGLTDPRVAGGDFPFDRPTLRSELPEGPDLRLQRDSDGNCDLELLPPEDQVVDGYRAFRGTFPPAPGGGLATLGTRGSDPLAAYDHAEIDCGLLPALSDVTSLVDEPGSYYFLVAAVSDEGCHGLGRSYRALPGGESVRSMGRPHRIVNCQACLP